MDRDVTVQYLTGFFLCCLCKVLMLEKMLLVFISAIFKFAQWQNYLCEQEGVLLSIQVYVSTTLKGKVSLRIGIIDGLRTLKEEIVAPLQGRLKYEYRACYAQSAQAPCHCSVRSCPSQVPNAAAFSTGMRKVSDGAAGLDKVVTRNTGLSSCLGK